MPVITLTQWKGGVGKSTLAVHLAAALDGVLVDLEPWGAATTWWAGPHAMELWQAPGPAPVLRALERGVAPRPRKGSAGRPLLVASHEQLLSLMDGATGGAAAWGWRADTGQPALMIATQNGVRMLADALRDGLREWAQTWGVPVVVDTPGGHSPLTDGAIAAADVAVVPVTLDPWSLPALGKFLAVYAPRVRAGVVIPNRVRGRVREERFIDALGLADVVRPPFVVGPPVEESEVLRFSERPLEAGVAPGAARAAAIEQISAVAGHIMDVAAAAAAA